MKIILVRHAETEEGKARIVLGHLPGHLSSKGVEQAKALALQLKDEPIDVIFSSDLERAADTARQVAKFHPDVPLHFVEGLRERYLGDLQGTKKEGLVWHEYAGLEYEHDDALFARARRFLEKIASEYPDGTVLVVAHHDINNALTAVIRGRAARDVRDMGRQENCGVRVFEGKVF